MKAEEFLLLDQQRQEECFKLYVEHKGIYKEFVRGLIEKYSREDGVESYSAVKIHNYVKKYMSTHDITPEQREVIANFDSIVLHTKISIGKKVYDAFYANNCDYSLLATKSLELGLIDDSTGLPLDEFGLKRYLTYYTNTIRGKEIFDLFIEHKGLMYKFSDELIAKYILEDGVDSYTVAKIDSYFKGYINEIDCNPVEKRSYDGVIYKLFVDVFLRGETACRLYIKYNGNWDLLMQEFNNIPGYVDSKTGLTLNQARIQRDLNYFLENTDDLELTRLYGIVKRLNNSSVARNLGLEGFKLLFEYIKNGDEESIKDIIDTKGISKENFKSLINTYNHYYPNDTLTISKAYKYVDTLFSVKRDIKDPDKLEKVKEVELNSMEKIECLKNLLRYFVQCDNFVSIPEELMNFYGLTLKEYNNALENAKTSSDPELKALLDRFNAKLEFAFNEEQNRIDKLLNYINNGIYINGEFVDFNLYFFYFEFGIDYKGMSSTLSKHLKPGEVKKIRDWFKSKFNFQRIYKPEEEEELIKSINFSNSNGELTYDQKKIITSYIISQGWPLGTVIYSDMIQSVLNGYLDLESLNNSVGKHI